MGHVALLVVTYLHTTPPSALAPELADLNRLLYRTERPVSPMERRLEASDTPLGAGPLISGPSASGVNSSILTTNDSSMRFAFTDPSDGQAKSLTAAELAEREGERQALLDWIRSGASQAAYARDDYRLSSSAASKTITPAFLVDSTSVATDPSPPRVRIRSLINERCVTCHNEADGDDTARLVPFDTYDAIARYLVPDSDLGLEKLEVVGQLQQVLIERIHARIEHGFECRFALLLQALGIAQCRLAALRLLFELIEQAHDRSFGLPTVARSYPKRRPAKRGQLNVLRGATRTLANSRPATRDNNSAITLIAVSKPRSIWPSNTKNRPPSR